MEPLNNPRVLRVKGGWGSCLRGARPLNPTHAAADDVYPLLMDYHQWKIFILLSLEQFSSPKNKLNKISRRKIIQVKNYLALCPLPCSLFSTLPPSFDPGMTIFLGLRFPVHSGEAYIICPQSLTEIIGAQLYKALLPVLFCGSKLHHLLQRVWVNN